VFSSGTKFILSFVIVGQNVPKTKWGDAHTHTHTHTKHGGLIRKKKEEGK
jgi:hypothetical protein